MEEILKWLFAGMFLIMMWPPIFTNRQLVCDQVCHDDDGSRLPGPRDVWDGWISCYNSNSKSNSLGAIIRSNPIDTSVSRNVPIPTPYTINIFHGSLPTRLDWNDICSITYNNISTATATTTYPSLWHQCSLFRKPKCQNEFHSESFGCFIFSNWYLLPCH